MQTSFIKSVTFDCVDALVFARFWAAKLGGELKEDPTPEKAFVEAPGWEGPALWFQRVPEQKSAKNRMHLDLRAPNTLAAEVERLESLGARIVRTQAIVVMSDPEGNEFCVEDGLGDAS